MTLVLGLLTEVCILWELSRFSHQTSISVALMHIFLVSSICLLMNCCRIYCLTPCLIGPRSLYYTPTSRVTTTSTCKLMHYLLCNFVHLCKSRSNIMCAGSLCQTLNHPFLLLARFVSNVYEISVRRSIYWVPTDRWPTTSHLGKSQMAISPQGIIRFTSCFVLWWGFRGQRFELRYFQFRQIQIQDGSTSATILENPHGDISAADRPIYSVFGFRMWFSGWEDWMALILAWPDSIGMWEKTMHEE